MANPNVVSLRGADSLREKVSGPEWEARVNLAAAFRVARCSSTIEPYCTGIFQPAKSTMRPPCF